MPLDADDHLSRDQWWDGEHDAIDAMTAGELGAYRDETDRLDSASADGRRAG